MDPITSAIVAAVSAGAAGKAGEMVFTKAYEALKTAIRKKFGGESKVITAVAELENEPDFKPNQEALAGRMQQVQATEDGDLLKLAEALMVAMQQTDEGRSALAKYKVSIQNSEVGIVGDNARVEGGMHFGKNK
jgi:hypothetical protein